MNLAAKPTRYELAALLRDCDDRTVSHLLWVEKDGEVHIDPLLEITPVAIADKNSEILKFKFESFARGNGSTGDKAALDKQWVDRLFRLLVSAWASGREGTID